MGWNIFFMILFGALSFVLGNIKINIPGIAGGYSDLREIPLLISIFHITNPLYTIGICFISALGSPPEGSYLSTFLMHFASLIIIWGVYRYLKDLNWGNITQAVVWFIITLGYYLVLLLPLLILTNYMVGLNSEKKFLPFYFSLIKSAQFEIIASASISALYLLQHNARTALKQHKLDLEILVRKRTKELAVTNDLLELKNSELMAQKEELTVILENLKSTQSMLIQSEKMASLGTLTSGIAHEINNPLHNINGGVTIFNDLEPKMDKFLPDDIKKDCSNAISMIRIGYERVSNTVQALMAFSFRGKPILSAANINKIIDNTLLFMNIKIPSDIRIVREYKLQKEVPVYPDKIHQVLINILNNAIYAVSKSDIQPKEIIISTDIQKDDAIIRIFNTGPPIPEQHLKRIFDPFFTTKEPGEGAGLGLSASYNMIMEHKGQIAVENLKNGVAFIIIIPLDGQKD
jgi:signal transduction histidine kinase